MNLSVPRSSSLALKEFLLERKEASSYDFYKWYRKFKPITYTSIRRLFWMCNKLGLIVKSRKVRHKDKMIGYKQLYRIVPEMLDSDAWFNPQRYMGWESYEKRHEYEYGFRVS